MSYKVLVCDDEALEREVISLIIQKSGLPFHAVGEARNGYEAVEKARELKPDVIFMDIKMPGKDGLAATAEIKDVLPHVKVIITTAYDDFEFAKEALRLGSIDYLLKPIRPEEFIAVLNKLLNLFEKEMMSKKQEEELKKAIKKAEKMIKAGILASLVMGEAEKNEERDILLKQAQLLDITFLPNALLIVEPNIDELHTGAVYERYKVFKITEELIGDMNEVFLLNLGESLVIGIQKEKIDPQVLASTIQKKVEENTDVCVTISIGEAPDIINKTIYEETKANARLGRFFFGGKIVNKQEMDDLMKSTEKADDEMENQLLDYVMMANYQEASKLFQKIIKNLVIKSRGSLLFCQTRIAEIMLLIWRSVRQLGWVDNNNSHLYFNYLKKLSKAQSLYALTECCRNYLSDVFVLNNNLKKKMALSIWWSSMSMKTMTKI
ncbi:response regulator [Thermosediminibacter litoriperuensis]|uniref:Stage 0 sporulation protein A homolog n=1 Tax=Thermosediminibacter litoriperuensis TaxID=291989 RepID=A0A5S5AVL0_9FIRM|nr:response regulator [Thermosediminibacter litoriperuensis]TYP55460.1 two-component system response regulator YesN [Thermosediminibacter litoriperuensis]